MKLKITLILITILVMSGMIWAGFTRKEALFPFLLWATLSLSLANMLIDRKDRRSRRLVTVALTFAAICGVVGTMNYIIR